MKSILSGVGTFIFLTAILFVGMFLGSETDIFTNDIGEEDFVVEVEEYESVLDYEKTVIKVVEDSLPAVVSIASSKYVTEWGTLHEEGREVETGRGTGFIISKDGMVITNKHVVEDDSADYKVFLSTGEVKDVEMIAKDPTQDIAILKIEGEDLPILELGDSEGIRIGQTAIAIGNALGELENTVSVGVISGVGREVTARGRLGVELLRNVIQTDAAINFGNSGGPLLDLEGRVVGVNTATAVYAEGIGFAIPVNRIKRAVEGVSEEGIITYAFLGVRYVMVDKEVVSREDLPIDYGALIVEGGPGQPAIDAGSGADEAGLMEGDVIMEIDGRRINENNLLGDVIISYYPGDNIELKILRDSEEIIINATLGEIEG